MPGQTIRLLHRIAVDWTADTFGLRGRSARARHDQARDRAHALARRLPDRLHRRTHALAQDLPDRLHQPRPSRPPRVLRSWQERIGRLAARDGARS
jgi:hypothetical protein